MNDAEYKFSMVAEALQKIAERLAALDREIESLRCGVATLKGVVATQVSPADAKQGLRQIQLLEAQIAQAEEHDDPEHS